MTVTSDIQTLFNAGAHFGYTRARRHPTAAAYIFGTKERTDIFDLEETSKRLGTASAFVTSIAGSGKQVLLLAANTKP